MLKADRDQIMNRMGQDGRHNFRRLLRELITQRKTSPGNQVTARELLENHGSKLDTTVRDALEAVVARDEMGPKEGENPPDFNLKLMGSDDRVSLSSFKGKRPVALIFGSYT